MSEPAGVLVDRLEAWLRGAGPLRVAVSGGVDSVTLAVLAHRVLGDGATMMHAVSPAVPPEATARVRRLAGEAGWSLTVIDAGEFGDARYMANPANRCYFCKTNLYATMSARDGGLLVSGTNRDDLGDYRPGLQAAAEHGVRHPYVETGVDKEGVRAVARALGLGDVAELPAAPCLSSRVETGIAIEAPTLGAINAVERELRAELAPRTVRCRVRRESVVVELDERTLSALDVARRDAHAARIAGLFGAIGVHRPVRFEAYRMGSAFLRPAGDG